MSSDAWSFKINPDSNLRLFYTLPTGTVIRFTELGPPSGSNEWLYAPDLTCIKVWGDVWNDPERASEPVPLMNRHKVTGYVCLEMNSPMGFYPGKFVEVTAKQAEGLHVQVYRILDCDRFELAPVMDHEKLGEF